MCCSTTNFHRRYYKHVPWENLGDTRIEALFVRADSIRRLLGSAVKLDLALVVAWDGTQATL